MTRPEAKSRLQEIVIAQLEEVKTLTEDHQKYTTAPPRATESAPDSLSLSEFANTPEAAANAASWQRGAKRKKTSDRIYMDVEGTALDAPARESKAVERAAGEYEDSIRESAPGPSEIVTSLAADLEADFGPDQRSAAGDLARLMGLEGRVRGIRDWLRNHRVWQVPADSEICNSQEWANGYAMAIKDAATMLEAALKPVPPTAGEPGVLTAEEMLEKWRDLRAAGHQVVFETSYSVANGIYCRIFPLGSDERDKRYEGTDPDPLRAFSHANAAFEAATAGGQKKEAGK